MDSIQRKKVICFFGLVVCTLCLALMPTLGWASEETGKALPETEAFSDHSRADEASLGSVPTNDQTEDTTSASKESSKPTRQTTSLTTSGDEQMLDAMSEEQVGKEAASRKSSAAAEEVTAKDEAREAGKSAASRGSLSAEASASTEATGDVAKFLSSKKGLTVAYRTHVQSFGWQGFKVNGASSGTTGLGKRLEAIEIGLKTPGISGGVRYMVHRQTYGWESAWKYNGAMSGTMGEAKRLEAIRIELTGAMASKYDIWYRVHAQKFGWMGWTKNGEQAGTAGYAYRLESIEIRVLPKGSKAPGSTSRAFARPLVQYRTHVQSFGWQDWCRDGETSGTMGKAKRLEGINISLPAAPVSGGITYRTHVQSYGWMGWKSNGQLSGTSGQAKRLEAIRIKLTGKMAQQYDVWYRVHAQKFGWMGWVKNGATAGTAAYSYRLEGIQIVLVPKGGAMPSTSLNGCKQNTAKGFIEKPDDYLDYSVRREYTIVKERYGFSNGEVDLSKNETTFFDDYHIVKPSVRNGWVDAKCQSWWPSPDGKLTLELTYDIRRTESSEAEKEKTGCKYKYTRRTAEFKMQIKMSNGRAVAWRYALKNKKSIGKSKDPYDFSPAYSNHKFSLDQMRSMFSSEGVTDSECQTNADKAYLRMLNDPKKATRAVYIKDIFYIYDNTVYSWANPHRHAFASY